MMKLSSLDEWHAGLHKYAGGLPARGTLAGALAVTDALRTRFDLSLDAHTAKGGTQIKGASGAKVQKILARLGEHRKFLKEGGRTNRGLRGEIKDFLIALKSLRLASLPEVKQLQAIDEIELFLLDAIRKFFNLERIKFVYAPDKTTTRLIEEILAVAKISKKEGPVAQHLVGAKLQLRFPKIKIANESVSAADEQTGRSGDFSIGKTAFHVTVAPMPPVFQKCLDNLNAGQRACLLVPARSVGITKDFANGQADGRIDVAAIECFVGFNVDEISEFGNTALGKLLTLYNERVREAETDMSLLIEIPKNLDGS